MRNSVLGLVLIFLAGLWVQPSLVLAAGERITDAERRVFDHVNDERSEQGLGRLEYDTALAEIAAAHSRDMIQRNYFGHRSPEGWLERHRIARWHRTLIGVGGENVWGYKGRERRADHMAELMVQNWMGSTQHRDNILRPEFHRTGVGVIRDGEIVRATQVFISISGFLYEPAPFRVGKGSTLRLSGHSVGLQIGKPDQCRLDTVPDDQPAMDFQPARSFRVDVGPGLYRLKFLFQKTKGGGTQYEIVPGPMIQVY